MTDDLRTRIASAIYNASDEYTRKLMVRPDCPGASEIEGNGKPVCYMLADAVIAELEQEWCVKYTYAPRFTNRGLDSCDECGEPCILDEESAAALMAKLNNRDRRFKPELVTRYVTEWIADEALG